MCAVQQLSNGIAQFSSIGCVFRTKQFKHRCQRLSVLHDNGRGRSVSGYVMYCTNTVQGDVAMACVCYTTAVHWTVSLVGVLHNSSSSNGVIGWVLHDRGGVTCRCTAQQQFREQCCWLCVMTTHKGTVSLVGLLHNSSSNDSVNGSVYVFHNNS